MNRLVLLAGVVLIAIAVAGFLRNSGGGSAPDGFAPWSDAARAAATEAGRPIVVLATADW